VAGAVSDAKSEMCDQDATSTLIEALAERRFTFKGGRPFVLKTWWLRIESDPDAEHDTYKSFYGCCFHDCLTQAVEWTTRIGALR